MIERGEDERKGIERRRRGRLIEIERGEGRRRNDGDRERETIARLRESLEFEWKYCFYRNLIYLIVTAN